MRIRPYKSEDAKTILKWCQDEKSFYQWTAGILGDFPVTEGEFEFVETLMPFTAFDETGIVGFFTLRNPGDSLDELRFGFVIVSPDNRGKGYGKVMLQLGLKFVFEIYGAKRASLGVFENNLPAHTTAIRQLALTRQRQTALKAIALWAKNGSAGSWFWKINNCGTAKNSKLEMSLLFFVFYESLGRALFRTTGVSV